MFPSSDKADDLHPFLIALQKRAQSEDDPVEQDRIRAFEEIVAKRLARNLINTWPGLFRLYQHPDGSWEVDFEEPLEQRRRRLSEGLTPEDSEVILCLEALEYIWGSIIIESPKGIPVKSDIPFPGLSKNGLGLNIIEIHQAAVGLFEQTITAAIVTDKIQQTLAPRVRALREGSAEERRKTAKSLKKSLARAIDILAGVRSSSHSHGNKRLVADSKSNNFKLHSLIAIDTAKKLVKEGKKLPTKSALRERIRRDLPNAVFSDRKWPEILKEAGLDKLPNKVPFKVET
jgi:hypothetical protein